MAEEKAKKPKIDLKARLGKTSAGAPAAPGSNEGDRVSVDRVSAPPSVRPSVSGIAPPAGIAPPPGIGGGSLLNPFAPKPVVQPKAAPVSAEAQTIKVEVSEELHEERRKSNRLSIIVGMAGLIAGAVIGFVGGGMREKQARGLLALEGAGKLVPEVEAAYKRAEEITPIMKEIDDGLKAKKFPSDALEKLNAFAVPFNSASIEGKNVGNYPPALQSKVFVFLKKAEELEDKKNQLKNRLGGDKEKLETAWKKLAKPQYEYAVTFGGNPPNILAEVVGIKEPWDKGTDLPKDKKLFIMIPGAEGRMSEKEAARFEKEIVGTTPVAIPIRPESIAGFTAERVDLPIRNLMGEIRLILSGDETPGREKPGLLKEGESLAGELEKLANRR